MIFASQYSTPTILKQDCRSIWSLSFPYRRGSLQPTSSSVDSVTAAAVAEVRAVGEHALRQALKLVRAHRSIARFVETTRRRGDGVSGAPFAQPLAAAR